MVDSPYLASIKETLLARHGIDQAIWIALLSVVLTIIFSIALLQLALGVLTLLWLVALGRGSQNGFRRTVLDVPMLAFMTGRVLSVPFSVDPEISMRALYIEMIFYAAFFVFTNTLRIDREHEISTLIRIFVCTAVLATVIGVFKYSAGISGRASSTTSGAYTFSLYLVVILPLTLFLARDNRIFRIPKHAYLAAAILVLGIIFSLNRMYWIVMAGTLVVAAFINRDNRPLMAYVFGMTVFVLVIPSVAHRFQLTLELLSHSSDRNILLRGAELIYARHPLVGFGPRTFREVFPLMSRLADKGTGSWHNDFLQVYMESGLLGLIPLCWLIAATLYWGLRTFRSPNLGLGHRQILLPLFVSVFIFFIAGGMRDTVVGIVFRFDLAVIALMATELNRTTACVETKLKRIET